MAALGPSLYAPRLMRDRLDPAQALRHPLWWGALVVLIVNDHALKGSGVLPGWLTGKLSDVAGLVVAPVLLGALSSVRGRRGMWAAVAAVGAWFALVNTVPACARACEALTELLGVPWKLWCDPTDLLALPALGASAWLMMRTSGATRERGVLVERLLAMAGAVSCVATSMAPATHTVTTQGKVLSQGNGAGPVYVIDSSTGRRLAAGAFNQSGVTSIETGGVVYGVDARKVRGIDLINESEVLTYAHEGGAFHPLVLTDGARLFMIEKRSGGAPERLVALDLASKKVSWRASLGSHESARGSDKQPILAGGLVIVPSGRELIAFDPGTGRRRWKHAAESDLTWPTHDGPRVFVVDSGGTIAAIDLQRGTPSWTYAVGSYDGFDDRGGARLTAGSGVLAFVRGGQLVAIDAETRKPRWRGPAVDDVVIGKTVAVARVEIDDDDHLVGIHMADGKQLWKLNADDWMELDPVVDDANGLVLVRPAPNELRAYTAAMGRLEWRFLLDDGHRADDLYGAAAPRHGAL